MAQNGKAYENEIVANKQGLKNTEAHACNLLTEDEQIELFAKLIIDIYLETVYEKNSTQCSPGKT